MIVAADPDFRVRVLAWYGEGGIRTLEAGKWLNHAGFPAFPGGMHVICQLRIGMEP